MAKRLAPGKIPVKRTGKLGEIANAALFLLSDEASFVSGAALPIDGGRQRRSEVAPEDE